MKAIKWILMALFALIILGGCQSATSPSVAPDFTLPDSNGNMVHLAEELQNNKTVVLLFYLEHI